MSKWNPYDEFLVSSPKRIVGQRWVSWAALLSGHYNLSSVTCSHLIVPAHDHSMGSVLAIDNKLKENDSGQ